MKLKPTLHLFCLLWTTISIAQTHPVQVSVFGSGVVESFVRDWGNRPSSFRVNVLMLDQRVSPANYYPRIRLWNSHGFRLETTARVKGLHLLTSRREVQRC